MKEYKIRPYRLAKKLSRLYDLNRNMDTVLSASMYHLCQFMDSERSSIFLFEPWDQRLTIYSSIDRNKHEIPIPKSNGVAGWVYENQEPALIHNAHKDKRFDNGIDQITGYRTRNMICTPLWDSDGNCLGTLQSLNKKSGNFTTDDLDLLNLASSMMAIAISNNKRYREIVVTNRARKTHHSSS